jgi:hypothetical protein
MEGSWRLPTKFLAWPYYGSCVDEEEDAHAALEAAADSVLGRGAARKDGTKSRRRSRPMREPHAEGD